MKSQDHSSKLEVLGRLEQQLGRTPTEGEIAKALGLSSAEYEALLAEIRPATFICLDAVCALENSETNSLSEVIADPVENGPAEQASDAGARRLPRRGVRGSRCASRLSSLHTTRVKRCRAP